MGTKQAPGRVLRMSASHQRPQLGEARLAPGDEGAAGRIGGVGRPRQIETAGDAEVPPAVVAVALGLVGPPVGEDAVDVVARDDLAVDGGHELEVVGPERARDPQLRVGPVPARLPVGVDGDPVGVGPRGVVAGRVRIGAGQDLHALGAAAADQVTERIAGAEPGAAVMEGDVGGVVGDDAAGAETHRVGVDAREVVEPEAEIDLPGVVLDQHQLGPAHRFGAPRRCRRARTDDGWRHLRRGAHDRGRDQRSRGHRPKRLDEGAAIPVLCGHSRRF